MDSSILKSEVFFFVATVALVLITFFLAVGLIYILTILHTLKQIVKNVKTGTDMAVSGAGELRDSLKNGSFKFATLWKLFKINKKKK
jgi:hypothetical protein